LRDGTPCVITISIETKTLKRQVHAAIQEQAGLGIHNFVCLQSCVTRCMYNKNLGCPIREMINLKKLLYTLYGRCGIIFF